MLFTYIFLAVLFSCVILLVSLWFFESEEDHNDEVTLRDHLENEKESIEFAQFAIDEESPKKQGKRLS